MKKYTVEELRTLAKKEYLLSLSLGHTQSAAIDAAWFAVKRLFPHFRAPHGAEKIAINTGKRRAYASPLGRILEVSGAQGLFGMHSNKFSRTKKSIREAGEIESILISFLSSTN